MNVAERIRAEYQRRGQSGGPDLDYLKSLTDADIRDYLRLEDQENRTNGDRIVWAAERMDQRHVLSVISSFKACEPQNEPLSAQAAFLYYACAKKLPMPPNLVGQYLERIKAISPSHLAQLMVRSLHWINRQGGHEVQTNPNLRPRRHHHWRFATRAPTPANCRSAAT